jgi:hypothetical protein
MLVRQVVLVGKTVGEALTGFSGLYFTVLVRGVCLQAVDKLSRHFSYFFDSFIESRLVDMRRFSKTADLTHIL